MFIVAKLDDYRFEEALSMARFLNMSDSQLSQRFDNHALNVMTFTFGEDCVDGDKDMDVVMA